MMVLRKKSWSPWASGAAIGVLSWFAFATAGRGLGITSAFESTAALIERRVAPTFAEASGYFADHDPKIGWEWMLVLGVLAGSYVSSRLSADREPVVIPAAWKARFGSSAPARLGAAFFAGAVMMLGARLAMGCTSGHGITGALQLAVSSWMFIGLAFATAVATGLAMYGRHPRLEGTVARV